MCSYFGNNILRGFCAPHLSNNNNNNNGVEISFKHYAFYVIFLLLKNNAYGYMVPSQTPVKD